MNVLWLKTAAIRPPNEERNAVQVLALYLDWEIQMRMPLFSYFIVAGTMLVGLLFWVGPETEPASSSIKTSQTIGLPTPFKAPPEPAQYKITGVNFAAGYKHRASTSAKAADATPRQKAIEKLKAAMWNQMAENPHDKLSITKLKGPQPERPSPLDWSPPRFPQVPILGRADMPPA